MANFILDKGYLIEGSSAAVAYRFCSLGTTDQSVDITPSNGGLVLGVVMEDIDANKVVGGVVANVRLEGIAPVRAHDAIALGAEVSTTTAGRAQEADSSHRVAGIALQAATNQDDIINVLLTPAGRVA